MTIAVGLIVLGSVLLFLGGESLVRGASGIALRAGLSPMVVGLTVVAFGTSCPELAVSLGAALDGHGDVALGNVVGSNIANIALVAALAAVISPIATDHDLIRIDGPILIGASLALCGLILFGSLPRVAGITLLVVLVVYTVGRIAVARRPDTDASPADDSSHGNVWKLAAMTAGGVAALVIGGGFFVDGGLVVARHFGLSEAVIALTLLAIGTSLPEIATTIVAALRGSSDLALGNAIGSCIYNILAVLGATVAVNPFPVQDIDVSDALMVVATAVAAWVLIWTGRRFSRAEGCVLLAAYVTYFFWLFVR